MKLSRFVARLAVCAAAIGLGSLVAMSPRLWAAQAPEGGQHAMGTVPCAWSQPIQKPDHTLDVLRTIALLQKNGFGCHVMPIEAAPPADWADFEELVAAADKAKIDIWPVLIPPSEGANSLPYGPDYVARFKTLAKLSLRHPNLRGVNIDDLDQDISQKTFTRDYVCELYRAKQALNPRLLFVPTVYDLDTTVADRLAGCVDGVWLWWVNLEKATGLPSFLENSRLAVKGRFPIYGGVYAHSTSWHKEGNPQPKVFREALDDACRYADGAVIWELSLEELDPLLAIARTFVVGGSSRFAGRCGTWPARPGTGQEGGTAPPQ
jgi:hypothetical protein